MMPQYVNTAINQLTSKQNYYISIGLALQSTVQQLTVQ